MVLARSWSSLLSATFIMSNIIVVSSDLRPPPPTSFPAAEEDVGGCILLFGAYANGNMGDIIQSSTMARLVSNVVPEGTCIWLGHPSKESTANGFHEGEFFANNSTGRVSLGCDRESGEQVSGFKAFIIGGGGIFESTHWPLDCEEFVDGLGDDLPVAIFGVGASSKALASAPIIRRANYLSGRDQKSVRELSDLVGTLENARSRPQDVQIVRDPVLSDRYFTDIDGQCWRKNEGDANKRPLCFVLPSATKENLQEMHRIYSSEIVRKGDILLNVFPKHQAEIEAYPYLAQVEEVLNPADFATRLCDCGAVIASRLHGAIISLQAGVPTIAAWPVAEENKVPDLMKDVLQFPDQFIVIDDSVTRNTLSKKARQLIKLYSAGRRHRVFEKLEVIALHTQQEYARMLANVTYLQLPQGIDSSSERTAGGFWGGLEGEVAVVKTDEAAKAGPRIEINGEKLGGPTPAPVVGGELSFASSMHVALVALVMIAFLGLPTLAYRSRRESVLPPHLKTGSFTLDKGLGLPEEGGKLDTLAKVPLSGYWFGRKQLRIADLAFFGLNYILWVVLALSFNICSKAYMRETRNPVALLAIQGWVGVGVLCAMNLTARCRRRVCSSEHAPSSLATSPAARSSPAPSSPSSSVRMTHLSPLSSLADTSWEGKCGLTEARKLGQGVWQAGLLHAGNAVLTSWSVLVGGVAVTQALKALEPVAAAGFSRWLLGSSLPPGRAAAVATIVLGLVILTVPLHPPWRAGGNGGDSSDGERGGAGMLMPSGQDLAFPAVLTACACCAIAARNILLKRPDPPPPPPPLGLLACSIVGAVVGSLALLVPWLPWGWEWATEPLLRMSGINAALCSVGYNLASFNLLSELTPVGHAVGNSSKRICLFASGLFLLGEGGSMSPRQLGGALVALLGLASYNLAGT